MGVKVHVSPLLAQYINNQNITEVEGGTVGECLKHLAERFPSIKEVLFNHYGELCSYIGIYINQESAYPEELSKLVKDGDELSIMLMVCGG
jgi:molybdopterin converting factor small subunit